MLNQQGVSWALKRKKEEKEDENLWERKMTFKN